MIRIFPNFSTLIRIARILSRNRSLTFWREPDSRDRGQRLARALEQMGPTFVKLGQALSTRSDLVGQETALALAQLRDRLPPFALAKVLAIIERQLGAPADVLFAHFEGEAAAAASIAQVHFAVLKDGREVAVKVLRPGVEKAFARDISLFYWLARLAHRLRPEWRRFKLPLVVATFEQTIRMELDLRFEAASAVKLRENVKHDGGFYVPEIHWAYTAQHVLTLERIRGIPIADVDAIKAAGHDPAKLVDIAAVSFFLQVFRDGFFHADLHPGNLFVLPTGDVAVVDFGIMGTLDRKSRIYLARILHGFLTEDYYALAQVHFDAGFVPAHKSVDNFALALMALTKPIIGRRLSDISVGRLLGQLFTTAETFEMEVQPHLLLLQKNMMMSEGVGRMLNPDVNMWQVAQPLIEDWARKNLSARARLRDYVTEASQVLHLLPNLVRELDAALSDARGGGIKLHLDTLVSLHAGRALIHRRWLIFAWVALAVVAFWAWNSHAAF